MKKSRHFKDFLPAKFLCYFLSLNTLQLQAQQIACRVYTAKDGLPSTYIYSAYQDKLGYLWVGTNEGLSRFDGRHFTNYGLADGLPDARTIGGFMDSHLRFWAITPRGAAQFKNDRFVTYPLSDSGTIRWVNKVIEMSDGKLWLLTDNGVYELDSGAWRKVKLYPGYSNHVCNFIIETGEGMYINYGDLVVLKKTDGSYHIVGPAREIGYYYYNIFKSHNEVYVAALDGVYTISHQLLQKLPGVLGALTGVNMFFIDSKERVWSGRHKMGIRIMNAANDTGFKIIYNQPADMLPQGITEDKQGNVWVGSNTGLLRFSETGFKNFDVRAIAEKGILRNVIQPPGGPLMINNGDETMYCVDNGNLTGRALHLKPVTKLPNNELIIDHYAFDGKGRPWYQLRGAALTLQVGDRLYDQSKQLAHLGNEVFDLLFDTFRKKILVAVNPQKFPCLYNDTSYCVLPVANLVDVKGIIMHLHQCTDGTILFATNNGLVYSIDKKNYCALQLDEFGDEGNIGGFCNDPSGDVWIVYNGRGVRRYHWQNNTLVFKEALTKETGLSNNNVSSVCFDNKNNLWVCTGLDVAVFSYRIKAVKEKVYQMVNFFSGEDLQVSDTYGRLIKANDGNIWLFSDRCLLCFYPDRINTTPTIPFIEIEELKLNFRRTDWAAYTDSLTGIFGLPVGLQLSHSNNSLGIYFKGISSSGTERINYSYVLEGANNLWSSPSPDDFVSFVGLPPGKYSFKVKAQLPNTSWSKPAVFSFEIRKAFWQTWLFYTLMGMALSGAFYALFRYRLEQKIRVLEMRNRFSRDIHDEIGSSISGINLLSQMAAEKLQNNQPAQASEYLNKVKNYSGDVIDKLGDMVWIFDPQNDSLEKLVQRLKTFSLIIALSKNIEIHFTVDKESEEKNLSIRQRKTIYLISKETLNNAFKYSSCQRIDYSIRVVDSVCRLRIKDDGKGFTPEATPDGNGLKNMQARADEVGATLVIQSQPGNGTIISLQI